MTAAPVPASKPANAAALRDFIGKNHLPVVGTFQAAGAVAAHLFDNFGGRVGQLANQPGDRLLDSADLVITEERVRYMQDLNVSLGVQKRVLPYEQVCDMSLARDAVKLLG